jgi:hypothetical protein
VTEPFDSRWIDSLTDLQERLKAEIEAEENEDADESCNLCNRHVCGCDDIYEHFRERQWEDR